MPTKIYQRHPLFCKILLAALLFAAIYIAYGHHLSATTQDVLLSALNSHNSVANNPYSDIISDEHYNLLIPNKFADYTAPDSYSDFHCKKPIVLHWFSGAVAWSQYDYSYYQNGAEAVCLSDVVAKFTYKKQDGRWRIIDCSISPSLTGA